MSDLVALNSYMHIDLSDRNADLNTIRNQSDLAQYVTDKKNASTKLLLMADMVKKELSTKANYFNTLEKPEIFTLL